MRNKLKEKPIVNTDLTENYQNLANAIIEQAANDYRKALEKERRGEKPKESCNSKRAIEKFFRSKWFKILSNVDGEYIIQKLREEFNKKKK